MENQKNVLRKILGKQIKTIMCKGLVTKPFVKGFSKYDVPDKIAIQVTAINPDLGLDEFTLDNQITNQFKNHKNPNKLFIEKTITSKNSQIGKPIKLNYQSFINIDNFEVDSIYLFEESQQKEYIKEIQTIEMLPSCLIFHDRSAKKNILINCTKSPYEMLVNRIEIKFYEGEIEDKDLDNSNLIYIDKIERN